jgi:hypothetical protein
MKKVLLLLVFFLPLVAQAQMVTDNFDSYNAGAFDGQYSPTQWEGWFGGASRTTVSSTQAFSGTNSLHVFDDVINGTEGDVVAKLGTLDTGVDTIAFQQYIVNAGTGAYYNLQHNYTGTAGDWAAEVYFSLDSGFVQTDGLQYSFPAQTNTWVEQMFIFDFTNTTAYFYYGGVLRHTWALNTNAAGGAGLNQINAINFYAHDNTTGSGSDAYYDDVPVVEVALYDVGVSNTQSSSAYTQLTSPHMAPLNFEAMVTNGGGQAVTNVAVTFDVQDGTGTSVFSETVTQGSMAIGAMSTFTTTNTYVPTVAGIYSVSYDVTMAEMDSDMSNNSGTSTFALTDSTHAKDDGNIAAQIGVSSTSAGQIGHIYEFLTKDSISSVTITTDGNTAGDVLTARIYATVNGVPSGAALATSLPITYNGDVVPTEYVLNFATPVAVDAGAYFVAIEEDVNNSVICYSTAIFRANTGYFSTDGGVAWTSFDNVNFFISMFIRPNTTGVINVGTNDVEPFAGVFDVTPNPTNGQTSINVEMDNAQDVQISVYDVTGKLVQSFNDASVSNKRYALDLTNEANGVYIVRMVTNGQVATKRVVLNK